MRVYRGLPSSKHDPKGFDFVRMATRDDFDVGILFSGDTDLLPAAEMATEMGRTVEVAAWKPAAAQPNRLRFDPALKLGQPWCHMLTLADFEHVRNATNYSIRRRRR